jgi:para-nitrobenzyl esterase
MTHDRSRRRVVLAVLIAGAFTASCADDSSSTAAGESTKTIAVSTTAVSASSVALETDRTYDVEVERGIEYGSGETSSGPEPLLLDLYQPVGSSGLRPAAILIHGGGFRNGSRSGGGIEQLADELAARGMVVASIDYHVEGDEPVPSARMRPLLDPVGGDEAIPILNAMVAATDDGITSLQWLEANAAGLEVDTERVTVGGGSAGAITSLHLAHALDDVDVDVIRPTGVLDFWGGLFLVPPEQAIQSGESPVFIVHGDNDLTVQISFSENIVERAGVVGVPVEYHPQAGAGHGFGNVDVFTPDPATNRSLLDDAVSFLQQHDQS